MARSLPATQTLPASELAAASPIPVTVLMDLDELHHHFARAIADEIQTNNQAGRSTRLILPVGPVGHFHILAEICRAGNISWAQVHAFFMDEYCDWQGRPVGVDHPLSFEGFARRTLFDQLYADQTIPPNQLHFPDPLHIDRISAEIQKVGGIDTCYGGVGIHGHIAFNEPPINRWFTVTAAEFKASRTRLLQLAPETVVMNSVRAAGGNLAALPPMAVTLGLADILAAGRIRLYCQGGVWQRTVLRLALFGSPDGPLGDGEDVNYPVTLLRNHPDLAIITDVETAQPPRVEMAA